MNVDYACASAVRAPNLPRLLFFAVIVFHWCQMSLRLPDLQQFVYQKKRQCSYQCDDEGNKENEKALTVTPNKATAVNTVPEPPNSLFPTGSPSRSLHTRKFSMCKPAYARKHARRRRRGYKLLSSSSEEEESGSANFITCESSVPSKDTSEQKFPTSIFSGLPISKRSKMEHRTNDTKEKTFDAIAVDDCCPEVVQCYGRVNPKLLDDMLFQDQSSESKVILSNERNLCQAISSVAGERMALLCSLFNNNNVI